MATEFDPAAVVSQVTESLSAKFPDASRDEIERLVAHEVDALSQRPVHDYVAVLAEREVKKRLKR